MTHPYLDGAYAPVDDEITVTDLPVTGVLPAELDGTYVRNGTNPIGDVARDGHHWFLGDGMLHGLRLRGGRAEWYRNRYVGSPSSAAHLGRDDLPGPNWVSNPRGANTSVVWHGGRLRAVVEGGGNPVIVDDDLTSVCRDDFDGTLPGAFTAHPKIDPVSGEMHAVVYSYPTWFDHVQYVVVGTDGRVRRTVDVPVPGMTMLHDMSLTERYAVVYDQPVTVDLSMLATHPFPFSWNPDYGCRLGFLPRDGDASDIVWVDAPVSYTYHPLNAYDTEDGRVVLDLCTYRTMFDRDRLGPFGDGLARLERWTVDLVARTVARDVVDERSHEFPSVHPGRVGAEHRFGWCAMPDPAADRWPTVKHDLVTGSATVLDHGVGRFAGEPVFVPRSGAVDEDDGWLVTFVHEGDTAVLAVVDAQAMDTVATVTLPRRVPFGFHGTWVPAH